MYTYIPLIITIQTKKNPIFVYLCWRMRSDLTELHQIITWMVTIYSQGRKI